MRLERNLKLSAAAPLWRQLAAARGGALAVDASEVEHLGALCLQTLVAAARAWRSDGVPFEIASPSPAFADAVRLMGAAAHLPVQPEAS